MSQRWSAKFRQLDDPEIFLEPQYACDLMTCIARTEDGRTFATVIDVVDAARQWSRSAALAHARLLEQARRDGVERTAIQQSLMQSSPMGLVVGCTLQNMSAPGVFEDTAHLRLLALLAHDLGADCRAVSRCDEFRSLLRRFGLPGHAGPRAELASRRELEDDVFALPTVLLALSHRSDRFGPELCGIDLVFRAAQTLPCWASIRELHPEAIDWRRLDLGTPQDASSLDPLATASEVAQQLCVRETLRDRVLGGAAWMLSALPAWDEQLRECVQRTLHPRAAMEQFIRTRARDASVYHHRYRLGRCPLSDYFKDATANPQPLLDAVARSPLVTPGSSRTSVLVNGLIAPKGKMFRVFTPGEIDIISRWIEALPQTNAGPSPQQSSSAVTTEDPAHGAGTTPAEDAEPRDIREAYYLLQGRALPSRMRQFARDYVRDCMNRAARASRKECALPVAWPVDGLREWLSQQHERADADFRRTDAIEPPSRESVIESSLQLAPLLCIDGAWLQGFTDTELASSAWGRSLFEIYWDELGNGVYELNHPKIYRDLLRQMGADLPPTGSYEFAHDSRLRDESFELPVLWLCLGKLPKTFLPEILGLNLAMELSGVGGGYRSAHRFLQRYGFDTHFVDLHNTIDNVATGHSAWAADAIDAYIAAKSRLADADAVRGTWARIRTGFKALSTPPKHRWIARFSSKLRRAKPPPGLIAVPLHHQWTALGARP